MAGKNDCGMAGKGWREHMEGKRWRENIERKIIPDWCIFISAYIDVQIKKSDTDICRYIGSRTWIDESL